eukprot:TRINITY_DN2295_c0_g1_i1.p1 TRINITY_DN2295_c0_g1~~TRINITY_DN2295_c0_g1_i1.p1  ORF type:complete len:296 (-),score=57.41 TRINITY_DN2295_c0_g1_i1:468-1355(-)
MRLWNVHKEVPCQPALAKEIAALPHTLVIDGTCAKALAQAKAAAEALKKRMQHRAQLRTEASQSDELHDELFDTGVNPDAFEHETEEAAQDVAACALQHVRTIDPDRIDEETRARRLELAKLVTHSLASADDATKAQRHFWARPDAPAVPLERPRSASEAQLSSHAQPVFQAIRSSFATFGVATGIVQEHRDSTIALLAALPTVDFMKVEVSFAVPLEAVRPAIRELGMSVCDLVAEVLDLPACDVTVVDGYSGALERSGPSRPGHSRGRRRGRWQSVAWDGQRLVGLRLPRDPG